MIFREGKKQETTQILSIQKMNQEQNFLNIFTILCSLPPRQKHTHTNTHQHHEATIPINKFNATKNASTQSPQHQPLPHKRFLPPVVCVQRYHKPIRFLTDLVNRPGIQCVPIVFYLTLFSMPRTFECKDCISLHTAMDIHPFISGIH